MVSSCGCASADFKLRSEDTTLSLAKRSSNSGYIGDFNKIFCHENVLKLVLLSNSFQLLEINFRIFFINRNKECSNIQNHI